MQGGGENTHDEWDAALVDSLRRELGAGWEVRYPRMPREGDPSDAAWSPVIRRELGLLRMGAAVVGHSVGGTILIRSIAEEPPPVKLGAIVLAAAPFVGAGGWPGDELPRDLGARLPSDASIHLFHGLADEEVPPAHADLYARTIPQAIVHRLPDRDHQLGSDLSAVAEVLRRSG